jgi:hypothetical protein
MKLTELQDSRFDSNTALRSLLTRFSSFTVPFFELFNVPLGFLESRNFPEKYQRSLKYALFPEARKGSTFMLLTSGTMEMMRDGFGKTM